MSSKKHTPAIEARLKGLPIRDHERLRAALSEADTATLLMVYTQLSRDEAFLERFAGLLRSPMEGVPDAVPPALDEELRERLFRVLTVSRPFTDDSLAQSLMQKMMSIGTGEQVDAEFIPLLMEQMGFEHQSPRVEMEGRPLPPPGFRVIVIGAGLTGILAGIKLQEAGYDYLIIEKNQEVGGTWLENTYPGVGVDTPSHFYSYSFEQNTEWSNYYPKGGEMQEYFVRVANKYGIRNKTMFNTRVSACEFDESTSLWNVSISNENGEQVITGNAVINAQGPLNRWKIPEIKGLEGFAGKIMHTAAWDNTFDLKGKRVAIVGTGASAAQLGPAIADQVESLVVFQRSRHWVMKNPDYGKNVTEEIKWALRNIPYFSEWLRFRKYWFASDGLYANVVIDPSWPDQDVAVSAANDMARRYALSHMEEQFSGRPDLLEKMRPDYPILCKRIVLDGGWLSMFTRDNVTLETSGIELITENSIVCKNGETYPVDVIAFATGFEIARMLGSLKVIGREGRDLGEEWGPEDPRAYLGVTVPGYPNFFMTVGPNSAPNHAAGQNLTSETQIHYIIECLDMMLSQGASSIEPTQEAFEEFNAQVDRDLEGLIWSHPKARSYYRNSKGRVFMSNPYRLVDYWNMTRSPDPKSFVTH